MKKLVAELISKQIPDLSIDDIFKSIEVPPKPELGDFAFPCFRLAKIMHKAPNLIAEDICKCQNGCQEKQIAFTRAYQRNPVCW